jgi:hypothetical protein
VNDRFGAETFERERRVTVVVRAGKDDDGDARRGLGHAFSASSIS